VPGPAGETVQVYAVAGEDEIVVWPTPGAADLMFFWYVRMPTRSCDDRHARAAASRTAPSSRSTGRALTCRRESVIGCRRGLPATLYAQAVLDYRVHLSRRRGTRDDAVSDAGPVADSVVIVGRQRGF
jgi:hypothetical protein